MNTAAARERVSLYFKQGSSDKEYHAAIEPPESGTLKGEPTQAGSTSGGSTSGGGGGGGGYIVTFAYGRRGGTLATGTKTAKPVDFETAKRIFDKLVQEKVAKGYRPAATQTGQVVYQAGRLDQRVTGILPQLLNAVDENEAQALLSDPFWWMQEKHDGRRVLIEKSAGSVTGINRRGLSIALPATVAEHVRALKGDRFVLDGEAVGESYFVFDLLEHDGRDLRAAAYRERLGAMDFIADAELDSRSPVRLVETAIAHPAKKAMLARLRELKREGVVFKRHDAPYSPGRPASGGPALKLKFTSTASCVVAAGRPAKRSVALELLDGDRRVGVGHVTIPPNHSVPGAGRVVEVRYLYAYPGGALFQPVYLGTREDITPSECTTGQLKYKAEDDES